MPKVRLFATWRTPVDKYAIADVFEPSAFESDSTQKIALLCSCGDNLVSEKTDKTDKTDKIGSKVQQIQPNREYTDLA